MVAGDLQVVGAGRSGRGERGRGKQASYMTMAFTTSMMAIAVSRTPRGRTQRHLSGTITVHLQLFGSLRVGYGSSKPARGGRSTRARTPARSPHCVPKTAIPHASRGAGGSALACEAREPPVGASSGRSGAGSGPAGATSKAASTARSRPFGGWAAHADPHRVATTSNRANRDVPGKARTSEELVTRSGRRATELVSEAGSASRRRRTAAGRAAGNSAEGPSRTETTGAGA
jgi:hypothetical protein